MALRKLNTQSFADAELKAQAIAQKVVELTTRVDLVKVCAIAHWTGDGSAAFVDLHNVITMQMKDISDEFWQIYEALISAEGEFLDADHEAATKIASGECTPEVSSASGSSGGGHSSGSGRKG